MAHSLTRLKRPTVSSPHRVGRFWGLRALGLVAEQIQCQLWKRDRRLLEQPENRTQVIPGGLTSAEARNRCGWPLDRQPKIVGIRPATVQ